ncbi:hypothetical protein HDU67_005635 [Dinochytrium kinnereticum]|nr:hypothetical protein HDU67_005635 [Dinochytrium kinnereticum]
MSRRSRKFRESFLIERDNIFRSGIAQYPSKWSQYMYYMEKSPKFADHLKLIKDLTVPLDVQFQIFFAFQTLKQSQTIDVLGSGVHLDVVGHEEYENRGMLQEAGHKVASFMAKKSKDLRFPKSERLLRQYASFCFNVQYDYRLGELLSRKIDEIEQVFPISFGLYSREQKKCAIEAGVHLISKYSLGSFEDPNNKEASKISSMVSVPFWSETFRKKAFAIETSLVVTSALFIALSALIYWFTYGYHSSSRGRHFALKIPANETAMTISLGPIFDGNRNAYSAVSSGKVKH